MNKDSSVYKMILLGVVCMVCGLLLSVVNSITAPIIEENALAAIKASLEEIYPGGSFKDVTSDLISKDDTGLIDGIYEAEGQGYIFTLHGVGYNSSGFKFLVGFDNDGQISGYKALEQNETNGIGSRAFDGEYVDTLLGLTSADPIPLLSGATLTSTAVQNGINAAKAVFNEVQGISYDPNAQAAEPEKEEQGSLGSESFGSNEATVTEVSNDGTTAVYEASAKGFEGTNEAKITVDVASGTVKSIEITSFGDTPGVGDAATAAGELARYEGKGLNDVIDSTSGASYTSASLRAMVQAALQAATGETGSAAGSSKPAASGKGIGSENLSNREAKAIVYSNVTDEVVYKCSAKGFEGVNKALVTIKDGAVVSVEITEFNDTEGVGDKAVTADALKAYVGVTADSAVDAVAGATNTSESVKAMVQAALALQGE